MKLLGILGALIIAGVAIPSWSPPSQTDKLEFLAVGLVLILISLIGMSFKCQS